MQMTMSMEACCRCGQPIRSGEPHMRTSSVDVIHGRVVATPAQGIPHEGRTAPATPKPHRRLARSRITRPHHPSLGNRWGLALCHDPGSNPQEHTLI